MNSLHLIHSRKFKGSSYLKFCQLVEIMVSIELFDIDGFFLLNFHEIFGLEVENDFFKFASRKIMKIYVRVEYTEGNSILILHPIDWVHYVYREQTLD